ncbi:MAG: HAMP domain-containing protein [Myxococcales bacterium]|nr:HAMP domain-containing protein [Myxococcales bacterium]
MKEPFWRTLSARILFAFAVVILTFGVTTTLTVIYIADVGREIAVIRRGYVRLALDAKDLARRQEEVKAYLVDDLPSETSAARVQFRLSALRSRRLHVLGELQRTLDSLTTFPPRHAQRIADSRAMVTALTEAIAATAGDYAALAAKPPLLDASGLVAPNAAYERVRDVERRTIGVKVVELAEFEERILASTALTLENNERRLRRYTIFLGCSAAFVGLLMTLWAAFTISPLRRLRLAAQRMAAGDYGAQVAEQGPIEVSGLARDFNAMSRAVEVRERELVRSERLAAVGKMAAGIAHEIRNPLSSISLNAELLEAGPRSADDAEWHASWRPTCQAITREAERLNNIVEDYLAFARLPTPRLVPEAIDALITNATRLVAEDIKARGISFTLALGAPQATVMADEAQLRQVLLNLLRNAIEAVGHAASPAIELTTAVVGNRVEICVADNGPGITADTKPHIFEPFFTTKAQGTGLGLALSQQIILDHGGELAVRDAPGGATLAIRLPLLPK